jgi:hypothetical protein
MLDFVSLDVEGAEHLALAGLLGPDGNHSARLIGVERPNAAARALLEAAGFVRIATLSAETDQFWAHVSLPNFPAVLAARAALAALPAARRHALSAYERWARAAALGNPPNPPRALREPPAAGATPAPFPVALIAPREGAPHPSRAAPRPCRASGSCHGRVAPRCTRPRVPHRRSEASTTWFCARRLGLWNSQLPAARLRLSARLRAAHAQARRRPARAPLPPLVLSGHAASLAPY